MKKALFILALGFCVNVNAQVPTNGLTAYYPFDGNTLDYAGTRNGVPVGTAQYETDRWGYANHCYNVTSHADYINLPSDVWVSGDYSISTWIYVTQVCSYPRIFDFSNGYCINNAVGKMSNAGNSCPTMEYYVSSASTGQAFLTNVNLSINTWYHIVFVQQGTNMQVYINNVLAGTKTNTTPPQNIVRNQNKIGGSNAPLNDDTKAYFDDFRIYNVALSATEVGQLFNEPQSTNSISKVVSENSIIYPNPSNDYMQIKLAENIEVGELLIINELGQTVLKREVHKGLNNVNISELPNGFYNYILLQNKNKVTSGKLVIK